MAATISRWDGMITRNTFAAMIVPSAAPTWSYAGQALGGDRVFDDAVEPAAMHRPQLARHPRLGTLGRRHAAVQPVEVEGGPDPRDARDHMDPAEREVEPLAEVGGHGGRRSAAAV